MYLHAWKQGLKTTYYLRSRPATRINKTTTPADGPNGGGVPATPLPTKDSTPDPIDAADTAAQDSTAKTFTDDEAVACSLENPESCEACQ